IPPGSRPLLVGFHVGLKRVSQLPQSPPHRFVARRVPSPCQFFRNAGRRLIRPTQQTHRISRGVLVHDPIQGLLPSRVKGLQSLPPSRRTRSPAGKAFWEDSSRIPFRIVGRDMPVASCIALRPPRPRPSTSRATNQRAWASFSALSTFNISSSA